MSLAPLMSIGALPPLLSPPPRTTSDKKTYDFCAMQSICSLNCPQYCGYLILPPPPPLSPHHPPSNHISPLLVTLIVALSAAFVILFYFAVLSPLYFRNRRQSSDADFHNPTRTESGLDETFIGEITAFMYKSEEGLIDATDCAVCLSEFKEEENLRLMPNCEHAFHVPCIDEWLKSHSSCPLCRAGMRGGGGGARVADVSMVGRSSGEGLVDLTEVVVCNEGEGLEGRRENGEGVVSNT